MDTINKEPFSFSYSKLKNYETCPRRYHELDIKKAWPEEKSEQLAWGNAVHTAMAKALIDDAKLPPQFAVYQPWMDKVARTPGDLLVECKWAITADLKPTAWFSKSVWLRSVADVVKIDGQVALIVDWKTGKSANVDPVQLILTSLVAFIIFPDLLCIRSDFIWLEEDDTTTQVVYRDEIDNHWTDILPRIEKLRMAVEMDDFPPIPNRFCARWCPVRSCQFYGKKF